MKPIAKATVFLIMAVITFGYCRKSNDTIVEPPSGTDVTDLIGNSSFESSGNFTLEKWQKSTDDTTYINLSNDVPASGGSFSVRLKGTGMPQLAGGTIWYELSPPVGTHRYRLSVCAKGYGGVGLFLKTAPTVDLRKSLFISNSTWVESSVLDTLTTTPSNTVVIVLGGDVFLARNPYDILFDLCRFEQLD